MGEKLANVSDIKEGKSLIVTAAEGTELALIKLNGEIYAYENVCPHEEGPVGEGEIASGCITCPWHGWIFDIESGECENVPGEALTKIAITVTDGVVYKAQ